MDLKDSIKWPNVHVNEIQEGEDCEKGSDRYYQKTKQKKKNPKTKNNDKQKTLKNRIN